MEALRRLFLGKTLQEQVREWQRKLKSECRSIDRQLSQLFIEENKTQQSIKQYARQISSPIAQTSCRLLTKELIRAKKQRTRLERSKALLNSLSMQLDEQLATLKITGILEKSTIMMRDVNTLIRLPELNATMTAISKEMMKAGIFEEIVSETLDMEEIDEDIVEAEEIDKILFEIANGQLGSIEPKLKTQIDVVEEPEQDESLEYMRHRLQVLRN
ncbi:hypothetical protein T552_00650 [Pneumocystis carinii B80]|uniref:Vacuolar protein-sorting-associated protein 24 n=1 Tax=Pneumocystis carinii (strain B80) TaxID=1408658 RepID=A0A0W4ZPA3_PNEC8|nr:hypothetical protein T552_00650 [Pneumocystis carinii B80]KTW30173.1 hypothetical protein T552_00650 [Pneumocystis carinii B80]